MVRSPIRNNEENFRRVIDLAERRVSKEKITRNDYQIATSLEKHSELDCEITCCCCGKPAAELEPFEEPIGQFGHYFFGEVLIARWRPTLVPPQEYKDIQEEFFGNCGTEEEEEEAREKLLEKHGKEKGEHFLHAFAAAQQREGHWECKDCLFLDDTDYWEIMLSVCCPNEE